MADNSCSQLTIPKWIETSYSSEYAEAVFKEYQDKRTWADNLYKDHSSNQPVNRAALSSVEKIETFMLHYLSRGALIPIKNENEKGHRSPHDYLLKEDNAITYYRENGNPLQNEFLDKYYSFIDKEQFQKGVIKPKKFEPLMRKACRCENFEYKVVSELSKITSDKDTFFDVSNWIDGELNKKNAKDLFDKCCNKTKQLGNNSFIGGFFLIRERLAVYFFVFRDSLQVLMREESKKELLAIEHLECLKGHYGAYPEIIDFKQAFAGIKASNSNFQLPSQSLKEDLQENSRNKLNKAIEKINEIKNTGPLCIYDKLITKFLESFLEEALSVLGNLLPSELDKRLECICGNLNHSSDLFYDQLQSIYLAVEEILFLSLYFKPDEVTEIEKIAQDFLFTPGTKDLMSVSLFNSGMACFEPLIEVLLNLLKPSSGKCKMLQVKGFYYEFQEELKQYLELDWEINEINPLEPKDSDDYTTDLLVLDLYPNDVEMPKLKENPVKDIIKRSLKASNKLTVILDTSTTLFSDPKIEEIIEEFKDPIEKGTLNLILLSSLAKFYNCGLDKYTGGMISVVGKAEGLHERSELIQQLRTKSLEDPISDDARRFYSLLFIHANDVISEFYGSIKKSTNLLYNELIESLSSNESGYQVKERDESIPLLGIGPKDTEQEEGDERDLSRASELQDNMYDSAWNDDRPIPLLIRASFPFPHSAVTSCLKSSRFIVGLDALDQDERKRYIELFKKSVIPQDL